MPYNIFFSEVYSTVLAANQKVIVCVWMLAHTCIYAVTHLAQKEYHLINILLQMGFSEASKLISMMWNAMGSDVKKVRFEWCSYVCIFTLL